jgi:hypothetical protein
MKTSMCTLVLCLVVSIVYSQDWINLEYPVSGILGRPVKKIKYNKVKKVSSINWALEVPYNQKPKIDTYQSVSTLDEYENVFKKFVSKYYNTDKTKIRSVKAYSLKIRNLSQEAINDLKPGIKYIYEGIAADSVTITVSVKKNSNTDISKIVNDAASLAFNDGGSTEKLVNKLIPLLDSISYKQKDSIFYKATIKNPNVYHKIKMAKIKVLDSDYWASRCLYFFNNVAKDERPYESETLKLSPIDAGNKTKTRYPEFKGKNDRADLYYYFKLTGGKGDMNLVLFSSNVGWHGGDKAIDTIPYTESNGTRYWRKDKYLAGQIFHRNRVKKVYIQVSARQTGEETIEIVNYSGEGRCSSALTSMTYPEYRIVYKKR